VNYLATMTRRTVNQPALSPYGLPGPYSRRIRAKAIELGRLICRARLPAIQVRLNRSERDPTGPSPAPTEAQMCGGLATPDQAF